MFRMIKEELGRFCDSATSRSWGRAEEGAAAIAEVREIQVELLYGSSVRDERDDDDPVSGGDTSGANFTSDRQKQALLRENSLEGYRLFLSGTTGRLSAYSVAGLRHGLTTLAQLVEAPRLLPLPLEIVDYPTNPWRGEASHYNLAKHMLIMQECMCMHE